MHGSWGHRMYSRDVDDDDDDDDGDGDKDEVVWVA